MDHTNVWSGGGCDDAAVPAPSEELLDVVVALLAEHGFEAIFMEDLSLAEQIRLMGETAVLLAPHGAGLTNMMFCAPGTQVVEIADLS